MTTQKKPQAGEWWQYNGVRIYIAGVKLNGWLICEYKDGRICELSGGERWQHLPDCTGWDWQPEVWPKYCEPYETGNAFIRMERNGDVFAVRKDGTEIQSVLNVSNYLSRPRLTEAEALARVTPAETFPQYWTAINDELYAYCERFEPNKYRMVKRDGTIMPDSPWYSDSDRDRTRLTKEQAEAMLDKPQESPPLPSPKRVPVRLWREYCTGNVIATIDRIDDPDPIDLSEEADQIKHDANGFYVEVQQ